MQVSASDWGRSHEVVLSHIPTMMLAPPQSISDDLQGPWAPAFEGHPDLVYVNPPSVDTLTLASWLL